MDTLTRMRAFIAVVENEGFSSAARKIGRSKALLSKYVRELEDELGALLLNRTTRQFSLTEAGHTYYRRAVEIVREIDRLQDMVRDSRDVRGRIKVSAPRTFADASLGQSLIDFVVRQSRDRARHPARRPFRRPGGGGVRPGDPHDRAGGFRPDRAAAGAVPAADRARRRRRSRVTARRKSPQDLATRPCIVDTNAPRRYNWLLKRRRRRGDGGHRVGTDRGQQPAFGAAGGAGRHRASASLPDFIVAQGHRKRRAGGGARRITADEAGHIRRLSAPALSAGQGARFRRLPGGLVQDR